MGSEAVPIRMKQPFSVIPYFLLKYGFSGPLAIVILIKDFSPLLSARTSNNPKQEGWRYSLTGP